MKYPQFPKSIKKGSSLADLLGKESITCLAENIKETYPEFEEKTFIKNCLKEIKDVSLMKRADLISKNMHKSLSNNSYEKNIKILLKTLPPEKTQDTEFGLSGFFFLPYSFFIENYGISPDFNQGIDPFDISMNAQYELTKRFTSEFCIRKFIITDRERSFNYINQWIKDPSSHVRRLCSEGTRPRLPWGVNLPEIIKNPNLTIPFLEELKNDESLYVRRSVANHIGDFTKDNLKIALNLAESWLEGASDELKWVIRHSLRYPSKKGNSKALDIRKRAK